MSKTVDLQPWLDYFEMLHSYERQGFLEVKSDKHEIYVTQPALHAMSEGDDPRKQFMDGVIEKTLSRLRIYAAWQYAHNQSLSTSGPEIYEGPDEPMPLPIPAKMLQAYLKQNFAIHVVKDSEPYDLLYTFLLSRKRKWWKLLLKGKNIELIDYAKRP